MCVTLSLSYMVFVPDLIDSNGTDCMNVLESEIMVLK